MQASDVISVVALGISAVTLGWTMFRDMTDRGRLKVHCYVGNVVHPNSVDWDKRTYLVWVVTNNGSRPVMLEKVGGERTTDPKYWFLMPPLRGDYLPKMLQPGEVHFSLGDPKALSADLVGLWALDTLGSYYQVPRKQVRKLVEEERKHPRSTAGSAAG